MAFRPVSTIQAKSSQPRSSTYLSKMRRGEVIRGDDSVVHSGIAAGSPEGLIRLFVRHGPPSPIAVGPGVNPEGAVTGVLVFYDDPVASIQADVTGRHLVRCPDMSQTMESVTFSVLIQNSRQHETRKDIRPSQILLEQSEPIQGP